jgi:hypothetical protein
MSANDLHTIHKKGSTVARYHNRLNQTRPLKYGSKSYIRAKDQKPRLATKS